MSEWRQDPITGRWVVMGTNRAVERGDFDLEDAPPPPAPCPLCEGHEDETAREILAVRGTSVPNGPGWHLRVVPNGVPSLRTEHTFEPVAEGGFVRADGLGAHEVIVESPRHDATWASMDVPQIARVLTAWRDRITDLARDERLRAVSVVKSHGARSGARLAHPHSVLVALPMVPHVLATEVQHARAHHVATGRCLGCDLVSRELAAGARVVHEGAHVVALAPFAARSPFAVSVFPRVHAAHFGTTSPRVLEDLAAVLRTLVRRLDVYLDHPAFHVALQTAPYGKDADASYHWRIDVIPRVTKVTGLDLAAGLSINPVAPEEAARVLRRPLHEHESASERALPQP